MKDRHMACHPVPTVRSLVFSALMLLLASLEGMAQQPAFIRNDGQWESDAKFLLRSPGLDLWITGNGVVYDMIRVESLDRSKQRPRLAAGQQSFDTPDAEQVRTRHAPVFISFEGASDEARPIGSGRRQEYHNYYIGNDPARWAEHVPLFSDARIQELYPGIDALFYLDEGRPRYDLVVAPGADASVISMKIKGATGVRVAPDGSLRIETSLGTIEQRELFAYQAIDGRKRKVECAFVADADGGVRFALGSYDRSRPLVIDPLVYSTYFGGADNDSFTDIAVDGSGSSYMVGTTGSALFPTLNASQANRSNYTDLAITKLTSTGAVSWSTFMGGSYPDQGGGIAIDGSSNIYITGRSQSWDFPVLNAAQNSKGITAANDAVVAKLTSSGTTSYSTFLGGNDEDYGMQIAVDGSGNAYITGITVSTNFPTLYALQTTKSTTEDAFITKLTSNGAISWSTYFGYNGADRGNGIAVDANGNIYITGETLSSNFSTLNGRQTTFGGGITDAFVTKLTTNGALTWSTYLGGSGLDAGYALAVDDTGNVYVTGHTTSSNFPTLNASQSTYGSVQDAFITKLSSSGVLSYSTYLNGASGGGGSEDRGTAIAVDAAGNAYITGFTMSTNFPTTVDAIQSTHAGTAAYTDAFVTTLTRTGALSYSTYFGGSNDEWPLGIAIGGSGGIYICGYTTSTNFPTLNAVQSTHQGMWEAFVAKISEAPTVEVLTPDATISRCTGTTLPITWSFRSVANVAIDISSNGGSTWTTVASSVAASTGSYSWTIPTTQTAGSSYRVRVRDASNAAVADTSTGSFTIKTPPVATLTSTASPIATAFTSVTFTTTATGSPLPAIQWQTSSNGIDYTDIPGQTSPSLTLNGVTMAGNQKYYRAVHTNSCGSSATSPARLTVNKATAPVVLANLSHLYNGSAKAATATTTPAGLTVGIEYTRNGAPVTDPTEAGSYQVTATINDSNYTGTATDTLVIAKATAPVVLANLSHTYDGTAKAASATTTPSGLAVDIAYSQNGVPVAAPTAVGRYDVLAVVVDPNYEGGAMGTLVIGNMLATVTLANLNHIYDGTAKAATAATTPAGLAVTLSYSRNGSPIAAPIDAGSYAVTATVDDPSYQGTTTGTLVIAKATAPVVLSNLRHTYDGTPKAASATTTPAGLAVAIVYAQNGTPVPSPIAAGSYDVTATIVDLNYMGSAGGVLVIEGVTLVGSGQERIRTGGMSAHVTPNPLGGIGTLHVEGLPAGRLSAMVYDIMGRPVKLLAELETGAGGRTLPIDLRALASGLYTLRITTPHGVVATLVRVVR